MRVFISSVNTCFIVYLLENTLWEKICVLQTLNCLYNISLLKRVVVFYCASSCVFFYVCTNIRFLSFQVSCSLYFRWTIFSLMYLVSHLCFTIHPCCILITATAVVSIDKKSPYFHNYLNNNNCYLHTYL